MRKSTIFVATVVAAAFTVPAQAEVEAADESGFIVTGSALINASPEAVWTVLVNPAQYWNPEHSWSLDTANMTLDPVAGGCFCESLRDGGSAEHMRVINAAPGKYLALRGALGPLQAEALTGVLIVTLVSAEEGGTTLSWRYTVGGYAQFPLMELSRAVDGVIAGQMLSLAATFGE